MEVTKDMFVVIEYSLRLEDGSYVRGEDGPASMNFIVNYNQILPALERRLLGMTTGEETRFVIPAAEAFGEHDPSQVRTKNFSEFSEGRSLTAGRWVVATNEDTGAQYSYFVRDKTEETVTLDFNHPLAGKDLYYHVKVVHLRPALAEELKDLRPCEEEGRKVDDPAVFSSVVS